ncbi:Galectin-9 [Labeo rohita]|uniref:Galectin-9 n=1 Tax=Labeo rohita TaxID=84645 RepID=A0ABQ8N1E0_LABRO|nr:Galectin-9 [Labeo rohita]
MRGLVRNPFTQSVPFCSPTQGGLLEGMSITVHGQVLPDADRFHVDLQYGSDIVLHFNPRYYKGSGHVVLSRAKPGAMRKMCSKLPSREAICLLCRSFTNGEPFSEFKHHMNFSDVDTICIGGKVKLSLFAFQYLTKVPYKSIIDGGLRTGKVIIIEGVINPEGMEIFLRHKTGIAFYYNPRFDENVVVCNSYEDGKWGEEEIDKLTPIEIGEPLQITISCSHHGYEVFVNGQQTHTYSHRFTNLEEIDVLDIRGDVQLSFRTVLSWEPSKTTTFRDQKHFTIINEEENAIMYKNIPFTTAIQGGLLEGMSITLCGRLLPDADRFNIDLCYGSDVVLHVNPRYEGGTGYVVNNTFSKGVWGEEERKYETPFPRGQVFTLQILVTQASYKISTNGKPFSEYKHRIPFSWVDKVEVVGKAELSLVAFQYPSPLYTAAPGSFVSYLKCLADKSASISYNNSRIKFDKGLNYYAMTLIHTQMVPYKSIIYGGLQPGKVIIIQGVISPQAKSVVVCLRYKSGIAFDMHLHFDLNVVVYKTYIDGKWGNEEQSELTLFKTGEPLQVTIFCSRDTYEVFVNGEKTHTFNHHYSYLEQIDVLDIRGDVHLTFMFAYPHINLIPIFHMGIQNVVDIALHFNPYCISRGNVLHSSYMHSIWSDEETKSQTGNPSLSLRLMFSYTNIICIDGMSEMSLIAVQSCGEKNTLINQYSNIIMWVIY